MAGVDTARSVPRRPRSRVIPPQVPYRAAVNSTFRFRPSVTALAGPPKRVDELLLLLRGHGGRVALDSAAGSPARWSVVGFDPLKTSPVEPSLSGLRDFVARVELSAGDPIPGPFSGGFLGALSYELGVAGERPVWHATDPWNSPRIAGGLFVDFVVIDHADAKWWLVLDAESSDGRRELEARRGRILSELNAKLPSLDEQPARVEVVRQVSSTEHQRRIECARESIANGDYYQANLAHRFLAKTEREPDELYRALREANPAPYMAYLEWGGDCSERGALLSASPELLLEFDGERAMTRPIKGTARRSQDPFEDAQLARDLLASEKDRAELAMIVDLERNDLGRVAAIGTVEVGEFPRLESFASVHHLVADVVCQVREDVDAVTVLEALFPGGSITGAPKLAAMAAIATHEGEGRGFFTGSLGFLDFHGRANFNILIRTIVWRPGEVSFHVGGGITWASDAEAEDRETWDKARALVAAITGQELQKTEVVNHEQ